MLVRDFLGNVMIKDVSVDPGESLVAVCQRHGWETFQQELLTVMKSTGVETTQRNVRLLDQLALATPRKRAKWDKLCGLLAPALVSAVVAIDEGPPSTDWRGRHPRREEVLAGLVRALIATGRHELLARVVAHTLALPKTYSLSGAHFPALVSLGAWLERNLKEPCPAVTRWLASCLEQLEGLAARPPHVAQSRDFQQWRPILGPRARPHDSRCIAARRAVSLMS
jgi:hypothetical protein